MRKNETKKDFRSLMMLLKNWGNVTNAAMLGKIDVDHTKENILKYSIQNSEPLKFTNVDIGNHALPKGIEKLPKKDIDVTIKLTTQFHENLSGIGKFDPIVKLGINFILDMTYERNNEIKEVTCSWHLDKTESSEEDFCHPSYHFAFGGMHMTKMGDVFGQLLLLTGPRIIHPPMDIILACDFVIRNFYKRENHKKITTNPKYKILIDSAINRYLKCYSEAFYSKWDNSLVVNNLSHTMLIGHH